MSESEEMYLITIATLCEDGSSTPIPISLLANELNLQPVSVNQMVKKLEDSGLLQYIPYKGVELTNTGQEKALSVLRRRRLWEVFLVENLSLPLEEADALACKMEHISTTEVTERLNDFLGSPKISPQGKIIPVVQTGEGQIPTAIPLSKIDIGETVLIAYHTGDDTTESFLTSTSIQPSRKITLLAQADNGAVLLQTDNTKVHLDVDLVNAIFVYKQ